MSESKKCHNLLADEGSDLAKELLQGVKKLCTSGRPEIIPRVSINGLVGRKTLREIAQDKITAASFRIGDCMIFSEDDGLWLNTHFWLFPKQPSTEGFADLSPQQTSFVVEGLPPASQGEVIKKVREWYFLDFLPSLQKGLATIEKQFGGDDAQVLVRSDRDNHIFDNHGERTTIFSIPYTESLIVGENLFWPLLAAGAVDPYERVDEIIRDQDRERQERSLALVRVMRMLS